VERRQGRAIFDNGYDLVVDDGRLADVETMCNSVAYEFDVGSEGLAEFGVEEVKGGEHGIKVIVEGGGEVLAIGVICEGDF